MTKEIVIDGNNFTTLAEFYDEIEKKLTKGLEWRIGRNLNAFNDVLTGGFGIHDYEEHIILIWKNAEKSKRDLGQSETIKYIEDKLKLCHPTNVSSVREDLEMAKDGLGPMLFGAIVETIKGQKHIDFRIE